MPGDPEVKGVQLNAVMGFLEERFGAEAVAKAIEGLSQEDRELLPKTILDSTWYPFDVWRPVRRISRVLAPDSTGPDLAIDMGRANADYAFAGVYRSLLTRDPVAIVKKFSWLHGLFFREAVTLRSEMTGPTSCRLRYHYTDSFGPARSNCLAILGFWMRTLELAGAANVTGEHTTCVREGGDCCEYSMSWTPS